MKQKILSIIQASLDVKTSVLKDETLNNQLESLAKACIKSFKAGNKVLFCGNGGSAADAQHLAAELSGRFYYDRPPLPSEALHVNTSYLTAVANDYSYDEVYARLIKGMAKPGDILIGFSTSGNSTNVIRAFEEATKAGMLTAAFTGNDGGKMAGLADFNIIIPSADTPRIQEVHILLGHILCEIIESEMFPQ